MAEERQLSEIFAHNIEAGGKIEVSCTELVIQAKPIAFPLLELPFQKNTQFTGREEQLAQISDYLSQQNTLAITNSVNATFAQAIAGLGGVGKSQLAIEYAHRANVKQSYQIIWFMNGHNLDTDYLCLAAQLKVYGENKDDIIERVKHKLQELGNYLLIIDDAENYETIKGYLPQTGKKGHVLITTRHRLDWQQMLELGVFTLEEALDYFKKITGFKEERADAIKLVDKLLGLLPLALTQAGAFIKQTGISIKEYIDFFETKLTELWGVEDKAREYSQTIAVTWDITIARIKSTYPEAENLLRGMSCLASTPNKIDQTWLSILVKDELRRIDSLAALSDYSMIEKQKEINHFTVHALVQEVVFDDLSLKGQEDYLNQVSRGLKAIYPYKPQVERKFEDYALQYQLLPHLEVLVNRLEKSQSKLVSTDLKIIRDQELKQHYLLILLADGYGTSHLGNNAQKQKTLLERVLVILEKHYGPDHSAVAKMLGNLGIAHGSLGDAQKQKTLLERVLVILEKHYGLEHLEVAKTLSNLSNAHGSLGDAQTQKTLLERALAILEKHYGAEHPGVAITLTNLSNASGSLGDAKTQKELLERALRIKEKHYGAEHPEVATTLVNLGSAYGSLGYAQTQKGLLERALRIKEKHYGAEHPKVAAILFNLGNAYGDLGDVQSQKRLLERALIIDEKHYGAEHPEVATTLVNLGSAYGSLGDVQKKKKLLEQALSIQEKHYGAEHPKVAVTLVNLSNAYGSLGDVQKKKKLLEQALSIQEKHYGAEHPKVAVALVNLGNAYGSLGDVQISKILLERALSIQEKHYGLEHPKVAATLVNLGIAYDSLEDAQKQKELLERALSIQEKHYGLEHPKVAATLVNLGIAYDSLEDAQKQKELLERALSIQEKHYSSEHLEVAITLINLSNAYLKLKQFSVAKVAAERAYQILLTHPDAGPQHPNTQVAKSNLDTINQSLLDPSFKLTFANTATSDKAKLVVLEKQLCNAANQGNVELLTQLLRENKNLNINAQDNGQHQRSALHLAVLKNAISCIKLLLLTGANIDLQDVFNKSPLDYARELPNPKILTLLLSHSYQLPLEGEIDVGKLLRRAAHEGDADVIQKILEKWPDTINEKNQGKTERTALHWAVIKGYTECVKVLLAAGANANICDKENYSAIDWAKKLNHVAINQLLESIPSTIFFQSFVSTNEASSSSSSNALFPASVAEVTQIESEQVELQQAIARLLLDINSDTSRAASSSQSAPTAFFHASTSSAAESEWQKQIQANYAELQARAQLANQTEEGVFDDEEPISDQSFSDDENLSEVSPNPPYFN